MAKVYFRGSRGLARTIASRLVLILTGREYDTHGVARGVFNAIGFSALSSVKDDFVTKSRGGVGADGQKWKPLSKEYLAYGRRFGPGEQAALKRSAGLGRQHSRGVGGNKGLLTAEQVRQWNQIFASRLSRFLLSMSVSEAKAKAAAIAWAEMKRRGARTKLEVFGNRQVDINRDTGVLLNSLSPGQIGGSGAGSTYSKPSGDGGDQQIFDTLSNGVIVGTNVPYAEAVNAQRPFLPVGETPEAWEADMIDAAAIALREGAAILFTAA